ncbi:uncharacterized protein EV422DRAFT_527375 [Fimicolochytrium jonesii]|uniref:uncharacterized protein n=1 Tax=Fimicolochytrium jonesii TaxID=1396493 RepID=UPI0022FF0024|nr:uncharacterized protein EV422DRAFT_527375 [Fimicolochytrium jonesii]KAI8821875.1 hypothetical protein EV422DRAFT_527375 [Fimicolochytrium jonesii]
MDEGQRDMWGMYAPYLEFKWRKKGQKLSLDDIFAPVLPNDPLAMRSWARIPQFVDKAAWAQNREGDHQRTTPGPTRTTTPSAVSTPNIGFAFGEVEVVADSGGGVEGVDEDPERQMDGANMRMWDDLIFPCVISWAGSYFGKSMNNHIGINIVIDVVESLEMDWAWTLGWRNRFSMPSTL